MLKTRKVLARFVVFAGALQGAGETKLGRGMELIELKGMLKCGDGLFLLAILGEHQSHKVKNVRIIGNELGGTLKSSEGHGCVSLVLVEKPDVIPGTRVAGVIFDDLFEQGKRRCVLLQI